MISIVTVNYNGGSVLENTIQSVLQQNYKDFEYIIIDGGSTDNSRDIIAKYRSQINYFISEPDNGVYDAMNKALLKCTREWVYFLNSGDVFFNQDVLEKVAPVLRQSKFSVVAGYVQTVNPDGGLYPKGHPDGTARQLFSTHFCHQALFVKRAAYIEGGMYDPRFKVFADFYAIYTVIAKQHGYGKIEQVFAFYDLGGISANWRKAIGIFKEREAIFAELGEKASLAGYLLGYLRAVAYYLKKAVS
jgi:glycosyltransferase involved in cell wall biosynthesis